MPSSLLPVGILSNPTSAFGLEGTEPAVFNSTSHSFVSPASSGWSSGGALGGAFTFDNVNRIFAVGTTVTTAFGSTADNIVIGSTRQNAGSMRIGLNGDFNDGPELFLLKAEGSIVAPTVLSASSRRIGVVGMRGYDGEAYFTAASITAITPEGWTTASHPADLQFRIVSTGSSVLTERMRLTNAGNLAVGTTAPEARVHVLTSVNGNAFRVDATTGSTSGLTTVRPAFNIQSTGSTSKVGFWTTIGSTRPAAYTIGAATTIRTLATTVSSQSATATTNLNVLLRALTSQFNVLAGAVKTMAMDFGGYGLLETT